MKETGSRTSLYSERLGDEKRIRAVLAGWGMEAAAIERMLDQHRALRAEARPARKDAAARNYPAGGRPAPPASPGAHPVR